MAPRNTSTACWRTASPLRPPSGIPQASAILAAAGSGQRLGAGGPKALVDLAGRPLYRWSLDALIASETVCRIVIAAPPGQEAEFKSEEVNVVSGGVTRSDSVLAGLELVDTDLVAIHDAARPLLTPELVDALVGVLESSPEAIGVIAAAPVTDTIKRAAAARPAQGEPDGAALAIAETPRRESLWAAQTPQVFRCGPLREALADEELRVQATDEASLIESAGGLVLLHAVGAPNMKVTVKHDLALAATLLSRAAEA